MRLPPRAGHGPPRAGHSPPRAGHSAHLPPAEVLRAFGLVEPPQRLSGGIGTAWRSGDVVLKRATLPRAWLEWEERLLHATRPSGVRVQRPRRTRDGALSVHGWTARDYLPGSHRPRRWLEIIAAGDVFHAVLADIPPELRRPPAVPRGDAWSVADRVAWDELPVPRGPASVAAALRELLDARGPVDAPSQPVHGDLTGNVVFADGLVPGIIDFSPYVRPASHAAGVVVADAIVWEDADLGLLDHVADRPAFGQCLLRAMIFRHVTAVLLPGRLPTGDAADRYAALRRAAIRLAHG